MLDPITQDACIFYGNHVLFDDYTGVVTDPSEGARIAESLGSSKAAILRNHGLLTVGGSVDEAVWLFVTMERTCQAQLLAEAAGTPVVLDHATAEHTQKYVGNDFSSWFSGQPLFEQILREQPELKN
jgi:ribulose-5-phosphate 4-epimerase/fuculose-1-phosphate aldolase